MSISFNINIALDGSLLNGSFSIQSVRDIERFIKVLQAFKSVLESMQEDDDESTPDPKP